MNQIHLTTRNIPGMPFVLSEQMPFVLSAETKFVLQCDGFRELVLQGDGVLLGLRCMVGGCGSHMQA